MDEKGGRSSISHALDNAPLVGRDGREAAVPAIRWIWDRDKGKHAVDPLQCEGVVQVARWIDGPANYARRAIVCDGNSEGIVFTATEIRGRLNKKSGRRTCGHVAGVGHRVSSYREGCRPAIQG